VKKQELTFIKSIEIPELRHHRDLRIDVHDSELRHLIITGRNGSGKTSLLEALWQEVQLNLLNLHLKPQHNAMNIHGSYPNGVFWFFSADRVSKLQSLKTI